MLNEKDWEVEVMLSSSYGPEKSCDTENILSDVWWTVPSDVSQTCYGSASVFGASLQLLVIFIRSWKMLLSNIHTLFS